MSGKCVTVGLGGVLDAPVAVEKEPRLWPFAAHRHLQRGDGQRRIDALGKGVADNLFGAEILGDGGIEPALAGRYVGDIADPDAVRFGDGKLSLPQVRRGCVAVVRIGRDAVGPAAGGLDSGLAHQAVDALARAGKFGAQQVVQAVEPERRVLRVQPDETARNGLIFKRARAWRVLFPCVIAAAGDFKRAA